MITLVLHRQNERLVRTLGDGVYRIGRQTPADLVIADPTISAMHAEFLVQGDSCTIRDLGSTNGTWLNGAAVRSATPVRPADQILFGSVAASVETSGQPSSLLRELEGFPLESTAPMAERPRPPMTWTARSWLAAAETLLCCCLMIALVILFNEASASSARRIDRFREFAAQYVHVLSNPTVPVPAPSLDASFHAPIRVFKADGTLVYPAEAGAKALTAMLDPATKQVYEGAGHDLYPLPTASADAPQVYSYPVRHGGDLLGYVTASFPGDDDSNLGLALFCLLIAAALSAIVLYLAMRPVHQLVRSELARVQERISALANGVIERLPRSTILPELNPLNAAIEDGLRQHLNPASDTGGRNSGSDFSADLASLVGRAAIGYCFVDADYNLLHVSAELHSFREFAGARPGQTLFAPTLPTVQAKDLVQTINADPAAQSTELELTRGQKRTRVAVCARRFQHGGKVIYGVLFCPPHG